MNLDLDDSYAKQFDDYVIRCLPDKITNPNLVFFNQSLASDLALPFEDVSSQQLADFFAGNTTSDTTIPIAQAYAGHQFGQYNPQLGDGRALILGEWLNKEAMRFDICLKGSGRTPFSRGGDGKAALGPMLREVLIAEAMHALGIPTTRSLAVVTTNEQVYREQGLPGAILTRVAASHIRIGTFQFIKNTGGAEDVKRLADYTIQRHYPSCKNKPNPYLALFSEVVTTYAELLANWMSVGFIHGVMNTDNMLISGETIDYGPCAFMEVYNPDTVYSSIDHNGRYAYKNQPAIAQWNLARFAETLLPLFAEQQQNAIEIAENALAQYSVEYNNAWHLKMRKKLGLTEPELELNFQTEVNLINDWLTLLQQNKIDFTIAWQYLANYVEGNSADLLALFTDDKQLKQWIGRYESQLGVEFKSNSENNKHRIKQICTAMRRINPLVIPRNHLVEESLDHASSQGQFDEFHKLFDKIVNPYQKIAHDTKYWSPADPKFNQHFRTFCGT